MNVFEAVKETVTARQAAETYGLTVRRNGMVICPFHQDKNPSMKPVDDFHFTETRAIAKSLTSL